MAAHGRMHAAQIILSRALIFVDIYMVIDHMVLPRRQTDMGNLFSKVNTSNTPELRGHSRGNDGALDEMAISSKTAMMWKPARGEPIGTMVSA